MDTDTRLSILSEDAQYDLSCACGSKDQDRRRRGKNGMWVYPASLPRGGNGIILKTLVSNSCVNDCGYCPLRTGCDTPRCTLTPDEIARIFMDYVRRGGILGLFLTSGVVRNADYTMDRITSTAEILRKRYQYRGFIHLKIIPGASDAAIEKAVSLSSAVSLNVEAPTAARFAPLGTGKNFTRDIVRPVQLISKLTGKSSRYANVSQTTQFIVGASNEPDSEIVEATSRLYNNWNLGRVYFSAYQKGLGDANLHGEQTRTPPENILTREHRLYQVDFLLRKYKWNAADVPFDDGGNLRIDIDPKQHWAERHPEFFPVKITRATRNELLRVPGLGPTYVSRILDTRHNGILRGLRDVGLRGKRLEATSRYVTMR
ncbi:MAG: radical SAM protein [Phycisphaerae bacterium]|nr:radical SAM protein [Phycisphaerae bacterium]